MAPFEMATPAATTVVSHEAHHSHDYTGGTIEVTLPDMFKSFLKDDVVLNRHYDAVKASSEKWLIEFVPLSQRAAEKVKQCDFTFYCAVVYPDAPLEKFQIVSDWGNWVFPFDDMFDEGELSNDPEAARREMDSLMSIMLAVPHPAEKSRLVQAHDFIFNRLCEKASPETVRRYVQAMADYRDSVLTQVGNRSTRNVPELEDMLEVRARSIAGWAMFVMIEYAQSLNITSEILEHPLMKALEVTIFKIIAICNDIVSYPKEQADGCVHNMVTVCRKRGLSTQLAMDTVGGLLDNQLAAWDDHLNQLRLCRSIDNDVEKYIEGIRNMARANVRSSFRCQRYFGKDAARVQRTRKITVMKD